MRQALVLALRGIALGAVLALAVAPWVNRLLDVRATHPVTFVFATLALLLAPLRLLIPPRRAAAVDSVLVLASGVAPRRPAESGPSGSGFGRPPNQGKRRALAC